MPDLPNILLITADQMRWDAMGCAGNPVIRTPNLNALAGSGLRFTNAFTPDPICVPARACLMTGNYPQVCTGFTGNEGTIRTGQPLLTDVLRKAYYHCYAAGKLHFLPYAPPGQPRNLRGFESVDLHESGRILALFDPMGTQRGIEDYFDYLSDQGWHGYGRAHGAGNNDVRPCPAPMPAEHYVDHWIANRTIQRIDEHVQKRPDRPFFLWMSSPKPHSPYDPPRPYDHLYDPRTIPPPVGTAADLTNRFPALERTRFAYGVSSLSPEAWKVIRSYYYGNITFLDEMIGRVLNHLSDQGLLDHTIVVFTSDHGDLLGDFGSCFKSNHLNGSVRIPFLVSGPGIAKGGVSDALVGLQDILPTFADLTNTEVGQSVHGRSLKTILQTGCGSVRNSFYATTKTPCGFSSMLVTHDWKYIYSEANATEELYDVQHDPYELRNIASTSEYCSTRDLMKDKLVQAARQFGDFDLFQDGILRSCEIDRNTFRSIPPKQLGWRFY